MNISKACVQILEQLANLVKHIDEKDFSRPSQALGQSTIGQHLRHTLEFFMCFEQGFDNGVINYDKRLHDKRLECNKLLALTVIENIAGFVSTMHVNKSLLLEVGYNLEGDAFITINTNATRELVYNIEHAVHHMAIMKIGIREVAPYVILPFNFGVAASTVRYNEATVPAAYH